jgi:hypothetical protein
MSVDRSGCLVGWLVGLVGWVRLSVCQLVQSVSGVSRSVGRSVGWVDWWVGRVSRRLVGGRSVRWVVQSVGRLGWLGG